MILSMEDYIPIVGDEIVASIYRKASKLYNKHITHINATFIGGGVAEILRQIVPIMNDAGLDADWRVLHGNPSFFDVTKKFHNGLQGENIELTPLMKNTYLETNEHYAKYTHLENHDAIIIHDPQPLSLIKYLRKRQPMIWRCHIDITEPNQELWDFLKQYMLRYDVMVVSSEKYQKEDLPLKQVIIAPAIDPLSMKNCELTQDQIARQIKAAGIPTDKPIMAQVSRMDPWKDPEGVFEVFKMVKEKVDCRLLYCYNLASDDPQGLEIYSRVQRKAKEYIDKGDVIFVQGNHDILVNAIQRFSNVIIQKSTREGFGLVVAEALWKGKPVVASDIGGIPKQVIDGKTGFLVKPQDFKACADRVLRLLKDPKLNEEMGKKAKEHIRTNFLTTRLVIDYLDLLNELIR